MRKINFIFIAILILLASCQSIKDGLSGNKTENSDEFLVEKKNPLVMPPKFMELPKPKEILDEDMVELEKDVEIQNILDLEKISKGKSTTSGSAEDFVLKQIQNR